MKNYFEHDVAIIGGGVSGAALLYVLSKYTDIPKIVLIEKYPEIGRVNSHATNNSQTLHVGDIESNYTINKVREVRPAAMMVKRFADALPEAERARVIRRVQKMLLAVGEAEVQDLDERYEWLKGEFPELRKLDAAGIGAFEPEVMRGRDANEKIAALFNSEGYAVNFGALAQSLVHEARAVGGSRVEVLLGREVKTLTREDGGYLLKTDGGDISARIVVVDTDAYSLGFAKQLGLGKQFSLIPIGGSFYFTRELLRGKVYTMQDTRLPFAAVHGDADLTRDNATRWGPTARFYPVLEARKFSTFHAYLAAAGLFRFRALRSFISILLEPVRFTYLIKNLWYEIPVIDRRFFAKEVRKIVPSVKAGDLAFARGYGGMRLQRVDTDTRELLLGEGKIVGENIIFNMTPSPGASVCLYNAMRDAEQIARFDPAVAFDRARLHDDLMRR